MPARVILIADDDPRTTDIVRIRLEKDGFRVICASDGMAALALAREACPDLIVLDLMLPLIDGLDVCHILREERESSVPVIMLTARSTEDDKLLGLRSGADDYLTKPFSPRELSARINAVLRRTAPNDSVKTAMIVRGDFVVDLRRFEARFRDVPLSLTRTEFSLLATLIGEPERAFTRLQLLDRVFGFAYDGAERTVDVHVTNLRRKLRAASGGPAFVATVYGVGYRFDEKDAADGVST